MLSHKTQLERLFISNETNIVHCLMHDKKCVIILTCFLDFFFSMHWNGLNVPKLSQLKIILRSRRWKKKNSLTFVPFSPFIGKTAHSLKRLRKLLSELGKSMVKLAGLFSVQFTLAASGPGDDYSLGGKIHIS